MQIDVKHNGDDWVVTYTNGDLSIGGVGKTLDGAMLSAITVAGGALVRMQKELDAAIDELKECRDRADGDVREAGYERSTD